MAGLKLFHVNKIYDGGVHAVKDFTLDIEDGEFVVFVGPSGCGKSTALRMIAGLEKITSGDAYIGNRLVNALPPKERNVAMVFQSYALFPNMSVYDNISFGLRMHGEDKAVIEEKVTSVAEMLGLTDYLGRRPNQLSGGQKQRVALGRAIVRHPDVFLLDEPLSNLDAKLRNKMRTEISALHRRLNATFIYVTHDQTEAMTMGDKIVVMRDGCIMQTGTPEYLYRYPSNKFVAGFLGTPQMNFWDGELVVDNGRVRVMTNIGDFPIEGENLLRLDAACQNGSRVTLGLRPDDVRTERRADTDVEITVKLAVSEDLCTHTVLYGDLNGEEVIGRGLTGDNRIGEDVKLYLDINKIHLFDKDSEESVLPEYAPHKTVSGKIRGGALELLGGSVSIPSTIAGGAEDGDVRVTVPVGAIVRGNDIGAKCIKVFSSEKGAVSLLEAGEDRLYALGDFSSENSFGIDFSQLDIKGETFSLTAVGESSVLNFTYAKRSVVEDKKKIDKHFCVFGGGEVEAYYEFNKKMYRLGKDVFKKRYAMIVTLDNVRPATEDECYPVVEGEVKEVLDYGDRQYSVVAIGDDTLYVEGALIEGEVARIAIDLDNIGVATDDQKTILF